MLKGLISPAFKVVLVFIAGDTTLGPPLLVVLVGSTLVLVLAAFGATVAVMLEVAFGFAFATLTALFEAVVLLGALVVLGLIPNSSAKERTSPRANGLELEVWVLT